MYLSALLPLAVSLLPLGQALPSGKTPEIVGGSYANIEDYPYMGAIRLRGQGFHCGGTLLSRNRLLSAAHCFAGGRDVSAYEIRFGSDNQESGGTLVGVYNVHIHPDYNPSNFQNDLAMVELSSLAPANLRPAALPAQGTAPLFDSEATLVGWGALYTGGGSPLFLRKVTVDVLPDQDCYTAYGYPNFNAKEICFGVPGGNKGSCQGDSGGPAIQGNNTIVGVTSYGGPSCASARYPSVYDNVGSYIPFIRQYL